MQCSNWTYRGTLFDIFNPDPNLINLHDIANALSKDCRYGGQIPFFYSVAEHCILLASKFIEQGASMDVIRWALMHDAAEAYLRDIPSPIKARLFFSWSSDIMGTYPFEFVEDDILAAVAKRFKLPIIIPEDVLTADVAIRDEELARFAHPNACDSDFMSHHEAKKQFLALADHLGIKEVPVPKETE